MLDDLAVDHPIQNIALEVHRITCWWNALEILLVGADEAHACHDGIALGDLLVDGNAEIRERGGEHLTHTFKLVVVERARRAGLVRSAVRGEQAAASCPVALVECLLEPASDGFVLFAGMCFLLLCVL